MNSREGSRSRSRSRQARAGAGTRAEADSGAEQGQPAAQDLVRVRPCPTAAAVATAGERSRSGSITVRQHGGVLQMLAQNRFDVVAVSTMDENAAVSYDDGTLRVSAGSNDLTGYQFRSTVTLRVIGGITALTNWYNLPGP